MTDEYYPKFIVLSLGTGEPEKDQDHNGNGLLHWSPFSNKGVIEILFRAADEMVDKYTNFFMQYINKSDRHHQANNNYLRIQVYTYLYI